MLIEVVGKDSYKRESTLRVLEQALPQTYLSKNKISVRIIEDSSTMEKKAFLYPGLVIDGKLFCEGRIPTPDEVKKWVERTTGKRISE
jgi:hypothetical protein